MLKGFEHAWICTRCQSEGSVVTSKDLDAKEKELNAKTTPCCGAKYEYIGFRPVVLNIAVGPILKADPDYVPPVEEEIIEEVSQDNIETTEEPKEEVNENVSDTTPENPVEETNETINETPVEETQVEEQRPDAWEAFSKSLKPKPEVKEEPKVTVQVETPATTTIVEAKSTSIDINDLVPPGPKGVSNAQMIPAMKNAIKENSKEKLDVIKSHYPDIFDSSIKYIGKKMQDQLKALGF